MSTAKTLSAAEAATTREYEGWSLAQVGTTWLNPPAAIEGINAYTAEAGPVVDLSIWIGPAMAGLIVEPNTILVVLPLEN